VEKWGRGGQATGDNIAHEHCMLGNVSYRQTSEYVLLYVQQDATLHSLLYLETSLHVSVGTSTHY
jgi:hypothetical protein